MAVDGHAGPLLGESLVLLVGELEGIVPGNRMLGNETSEENSDAEDTQRTVVASATVLRQAAPTRPQLKVADLDTSADTCNRG